MATRTAAKLVVAMVAGEARQMNKMNEDALNEIGQLAELLDSSLFGYQAMKTLPASIHLEGLSGTMRSVRDSLVEIYKANGGDEELNIEA
jgi:hypothetical protein